MNAPSTLVEEIRAACFDEGGYPDRWQRHLACACCGGGPLREAFRKYGILHARCALCDFVCVDPYPPTDVLRTLYAGHYYTLMREHYEVPRILIDGEHTAYSAPEELLREIIVRCTAGLSQGDWLDVGGGIGAFASFIRRQCPKWNVSINEFNPRSMEIART